MFLILLLLTTLLSLGKSSTCSEMADSNILSRVNDYMDNYHLIDPSSYACGNIETWNIQRVTNLNDVFYQRNMVNISLSNWDTSSVTQLSGTFYYATSFTGDGVSNWDTSSVTSMSDTFRGAVSLNVSNLQTWNTDSVVYWNDYTFPQYDDPCVFRILVDTWSISAVNKFWQFLGFAAAMCDSSSEVTKNTVSSDTNENQTLFTVSIIIICTYIVLSFLAYADIRKRIRKVHPVNEFST